jgi:glucose-1-phosphate cytidylyltransferase
VTAVRPPGRYGALMLNNTQVTGFQEKPPGDGGLINGGFFVLSPKTLSLIDDDDSPWELKPLESLAKQGDLMAYEHHGFWQPMDTLREKNLLEDLWARNAAPWKLW